MENIRAKNDDTRQKINLTKRLWAAFFLVCGLSSLSSCGYPADNEKDLVDDLIEKLPATAPKDSAIISVSAAELFAAYSADKDAVQKSYQGKHIQISGEVEFLVPDYYNDPIVSLNLTDTLKSVSVHFHKGQIEATSSVNIGDPFTAICKELRDVTGHIHLHDCQANGSQ